MAICIIRWLNFYLLWEFEHFFHGRDSHFRFYLRLEKVKHAREKDHQISTFADDKQYFNFTQLTNNALCGYLLTSRLSSRRCGPHTSLSFHCRPVLRSRPVSLFTNINRWASNGKFHAHVLVIKERWRAVPVEEFLTFLPAVKRDSFVYTRRKMFGTKKPFAIKGTINSWIVFWKNAQLSIGVSYVGLLLFGVQDCVFVTNVLAYWHDKWIALNGLWDTWKIWKVLTC